jgi:succinylglutamic semialdehyde dehydrogenase
MNEKSPDRVVVGPFNFPGHLPNGHIVPALLTGNAVIFKPSEKTPLTGQLLAQCLHEAGLPRGVFSCLQGDRELSRRLVVHEGIDGVLFTGSYEVGLRIKQDTLTQHWKLLALEMGGKNPTIVFDDASLDYSVRESLISSYITTGQRCSATSRILVQDAIYDRFVEKFHALAKGFKIGQPLTQPFMGPLIDQSSVDRYMKVIGIASREGFELLMRGKSLRENYVTPTIALSEELTLDKVKKSYVLQNEIFGPFVTIERFSSSEKAIESANCNSYGLVASVFTQNQKRYEEVFSELNYGLINWNQATIGASSQLPFGGIKKSGNHRPTALTSSLYTTYPVACLEVHDTSKENTKVQGLDETKTS